MENITAKKIIKTVNEASFNDRTCYWRTLDKPDGTPVKPFGAMFPQDLKQASQWTPEEHAIPGRTYSMWKRPLVKGAWSGDWTIFSKNFEVLS